MSKRFRVVLVCLAMLLVVTVAVGRSVTSKAEESERISINNCTIRLSGDKFEYTGEEIKPWVYVRYGNETLAENTDYTVYYRNNVEKGLAQVIIKGIGEFEGVYTAAFFIE